jgi:flavin prenyltransferase
VRLIVGINGATGAPLAIHPLEVLPDVKTHLAVTQWAPKTIELETPYMAHNVAELAVVYHNNGDQAAIISSGSFRPTGWSSPPVP